MKAVIVDDDRNAVDFLCLKLQSYDFIQIIATFCDACEALAYLIRNACDILFLDINLPNISGIYIAEQVISIYPDTKLCFVTAYDEFAIKAFELNAIDYLLKPYTEDRLSKCMNRLKNVAPNHISLDNLSDHSNFDLDMICGYEDKNINLIPSMDIYYIEVLSRDVLIHTKNKIFCGNKSLTFYEDKLKKKSFFRTHKCYLVNLSKVSCFKPRINYTYDMYFRDINDFIPVSRNKIKELKMIFDH